jgi:peptidyl-prolyl cis-trans isomerase C
MKFAAFLLPTIVLVSWMGPAHAQLVDPDAEKIVATRGTAVTKVVNIDAMLAKVPVEQRAAVVAAPARMQQLIESSLMTQQLASKGRELKLDQDPIVQLRMENARNEILSDIALNYIVANAPMPDLTVLAKEQYQSNQSAYNLPDGFKVQHILIGKEGRTPEQIKSLAEEVLAKAKMPGADFNQLVSDYSDDPSKTENKGVLVVDQPGQYLEPFDTAARTLKKAGDFTPLIETVYGTHIIKLVNLTKAHVKPFDEVKASIIATLQKEHRDAVRARTLSDMRSDNPVVHEDLLDLLVGRYGRLATVQDARPSMEVNAIVEPKN